MDQALTLTQSVAVILLAIPAVESMRRRLAAFGMARNIAIGACLLLAGAVVMYNSVVVLDGIRIDPRAALVALAAAFYGPAWAIAIVLGLAVERVLLGGSGTVPGIVSLLIVAGGSIALWHRMSRTRSAITRSHLLLYAALAALIPSVVGVFAPGMTWPVWFSGVIVFIPTSFVAVILPGLILLKERERLEALVERQDKQAQLDNIAENAPAILFEIVLHERNEPRFRYVSPASTHILDRSPDILTGNYGAFEAMLPVSSRAEIRSLLRQSSGVGTSWSLATEALRADGRTAWLQIAARSRLNRDGDVVWDGTIADTTEQGKIERMKDEFIAIVSHELKTPVTAIRGSLGLLSGTASGGADPRITRLITVAERNAERLMLLVNDIVDTLDLQAGKIRFDIAAHAVRPLLDASMEAVRPQALERDIEVILDGDVPDTTIRVDPDRLQQILANLLSNAIKFAPEGSVVLLSCATFDAWLRVSVRDSGRGIPAEFRDRIFDAFTQAEPPETRSGGGTGLGLKITKTLVEELGGRIHFQVEEGEGTTFHVDLPLDEGPEGQDAGTGTGTDPAA